MTPPTGRLLLFHGLCLLILSGILHASAPARSFDIPAGDAEKTLQRFAAQSGVEVLFSTAAAKGVRTNAVKGSYTAGEAARRMLAGTPLYLVSDAKNGVLRIARAPDPNAPRAARKTTRDRPEKGLTLLPLQHPKT